MPLVVRHQCAFLLNSVSAGETSSRESAMSISYLRQRGSITSVRSILKGSSRREMEVYRFDDEDDTHRLSTASARPVSISNLLGVSDTEGDNKGMSRSSLTVPKAVSLSARNFELHRVDENEDLPPSISKSSCLSTRTIPKGVSMSRTVEVYCLPDVIETSESECDEQDNLKKTEIELQDLESGNSKSDIKSTKSGISKHNSTRFVFDLEELEAGRKSISDLNRRPTEYRKKIFKFIKYLLVCLKIWFLYGHFAHWRVQHNAASIFENLDANACPLVDDSSTLAISKTIKDFVNSVEKDLPDTTFYPWMLTMIGALRYGGNAVYDSENLYVTDSDIDIMISAQGETKDYTAQIQQEMCDFFLWQGYYAYLTPASDDSKAFLTIGHLAYSQLGWWRVSNAVANVLSWQFRQEGWDVFADLIKYDFWRKLLLTPYWAHTTIITFHEDFGGIQADSSKKASWGGQEWPYPVDDNKLVQYFNSDYPTEKIDAVCDFYKPTSKWKDDTISASSKKMQVVNACQKILQNNGYYSFSHCPGA